MKREDIDEREDRYQPEARERDGRETVMMAEAKEYKS